MPAQKGNKTGRQFAKGNKGGPGRPKVSEIERRVRDATRKDIAEVWEQLNGLSEDQIKKIAKDSKQPALKVGMASGYLHWIKTGEFSKLDRILDRVIGKVKQNIEHSGDSDNPLEINLKHEATELMKLLNAANKPKKRS